MSDERAHAPARSAWIARLAVGLGAALLTIQALLGLWSVDDAFTRGHNGWNSSAYLLSARNSLRWERLLPHQYDTEPRPPPKAAAYTHHPLAMHLHNVAAVWLLGDTPAAVRGVAALHAVLALCALILVVGRLWSWAHGLVAGAIYVCLPINAIYLNMANHSSGFIAWSLGMLYGYLRFRETGRGCWFALLIGAAFLATAWDWPAYYVAFLIACHWFFGTLLARFGPGPRPASRPFVLPFVGYCAFILATVAGLLLVFYLATGSLEDLEKTLLRRQAGGGSGFDRMVAIVPELMFTWPVLAAVLAWLIGLLVRAIRRCARPRDLIPFSFLLAGLGHFFLFKGSTVVHEYWLWTALPAVAIAVSEVVLWLWRLPAHLPTRVAAAALALFIPGRLLARSIEIVPSARYVGGSMWFISNDRGDHPSPYDSGRAELRFADRVRSWTDRWTGVLVHPGIDRFVPEPRFTITLDRGVRRVFGSRVTPPPADHGYSGWVLIGDRADFDLPALLALAQDARLVLYDHFFMVDFRRRDRSVEAYALALGERSWSWTLLHTPFERPRIEVRDEALERDLAARRAQ
jgi:hypothetical protein